MIYIQRVQNYHTLEHGSWEDAQVGQVLPQGLELTPFLKGKELELLNYL